MATTIRGLMAAVSGRVFTPRTITIATSIIWTYLMLFCPVHIAGTLGGDIACSFLIYSTLFPIIVGAIVLVVSCIIEGKTETRISRDDWVREDLPLIIGLITMTAVYIRIQAIPGMFFYLGIGGWVMGIFYYLACLLMVFIGITNFEGSLRTWIGPKDQAEDGLAMM